MFIRFHPLREFAVFLVVMACLSAFPGVSLVRGDAGPAVDVATLRSGLMTTWRSGDRTISRLEHEPAFQLDEDQSPHPAIDPAQFVGEYVGWLNVREPGSYTFSTEVIGSFSLDLNGKAILSARSSSAKGRTTAQSRPVVLAAGPVALRARFSKQRGGPALLRLFWRKQDAGEILEPLPAMTLMHDPDQETEELRVWSQIRRGHDLVERYGCFRCHPGGPVVTGSSSSMLPGPDLTALSQRVSAAWVYHWLDRPRAFHPNTAMPDLFGDSPADRVDLYSVFARLTGDSPGPDRANGAFDPALANKGKRSFAQTGCIACHRAVGEESDEFATLRSVAGLGSKMTLAGIERRIAKPTWHFPAALMPDFRLKQEDPTRLRAIAHYLVSNRDASFEVVPQSPSIDAAKRRFHALVSQPDVRDRFDRLADTEKWKRLGEAVIRNRRCLSCHVLENLSDEQPDPASSATSRPVTDLTKGCLAQRVAAGVPDFGLDASSRSAIGVFFRQMPTFAYSSPPYEVGRRLRRLGCVNCHARDGQPGRFAQRITRFVPLGSDETILDVVPPDLTGLGRKLLPSAIARVLEEGSVARPWKKVKMPIFGQHHLRDLARLLVLVDGEEADFQQKRPADADPNAQETGRLLVGRTGLSCVSCHDIAGKKSTGVRGPDLANVFARVRRDWYRRWVLHPQRFTPGTRMPTFFPGGLSVEPRFFDGNADKQIDAIWAYLSQGKALPLPILDDSAGAMVAGGESPKLVPTDRPIFARGFFGKNGGLRGIGLGFPENTHFGFDSQRCRLVSAWQGSFVELGGWTGTGRGGHLKDNVKVLGEVFWHGPDRTILALGRSENPLSLPPVASESLRVRYEACWASADDAGFGYRIEIEPDVWIRIEDRPRPLDDEETTGFRRTLTLRGVPTNRIVWLCVEDRLPANGSVSFLDARGEPIPSKGTNQKLRTADMHRAVWVKHESSQGVLLNRIRGAPPGARWIFGTRAVEAKRRKEPIDLSEIWVSFPAVAAKSSLTAALIHLRFDKDDEVDFEAIDRRITDPEAETMP